MQPMVRIVSSSLITILSLAVLAAPVHSAEPVVRSTKLAPGLAEEVATHPGPYPVVVLLWQQELLDPRLAPLSFAEHVPRFVAEAQRLVDRILDGMLPSEIELRHRFGTFPGFSGWVSAEGLKRLAAEPAVRLILPEARATLHRAEGSALMGVPTVHAQGFDGRGVSVAVIDDGVDYTHAELGNSGFPNSVVVGGRDTGDDDSNPFPDQGDEGLDDHGTAVAGIIAGSQGGVAPGAKIVALKYTGANAGDLSSILAAIDWAVTNRLAVQPPIGVINMSLGFDAFSGFFGANCDADPAAVPFRQAVDRANAAGIVVVASTGNENEKAATSIPSCLSNVVSVGAVYDADIGPVAFESCEEFETGADQVTCYSNSASFVNLLAPSHNARTPRAGGGYLEEFGGTSAAAPYAAGVAALLMSAAPGRTPEQYRNLLRSTGRPILDPANGLQIPRVDAAAAVAAARGVTGPTVCQVGSTALCLNQQRFQVEVAWRDFEGGEGSGQVVPVGSDDSGLFYFFNSNNWEMLIKVLDGCAANGHYWVFFAATTNVQFTTTVTDTQSGTVRTYTNALGQPANAITDTSAFASCP